MSQHTITLNLKEGRLGEFIERYEALFPADCSGLSDRDWIRQLDILQGIIAREVGRQYKEQKS